MKLFKSLIIAFSLYSQIPMPRFEWKDEDMKYNLAFLPFVGAVIGAVWLGACCFFCDLELPAIVIVFLMSLVPLLITGGFHLDGFLDVEDALRSYKSKEEKLQILKDPHIGAFAIIRLLIYVCLWGAALGLLVCGEYSKEWIYLTAMMFAFVRSGCAISSICVKSAKKDGMLNMETHMADKKVLIAVVIELLACITLMTCINPIKSLIYVTSGTLHFLWYVRLCKKQFGGVTGDTAGFYITTGELVFLIVTAVSTYVLG